MRIKIEAQGYNGTVTAEYTYEPLASNEKSDAMDWLSSVLDVAGIIDDDTTEEES